MHKSESVAFRWRIMIQTSFIYEKKVPQLKDDLTVTFAWILLRVGGKFAHQKGLCNQRSSWIRA